MGLKERLYRIAREVNIDTDEGCGYHDGLMRAADYAQEADSVMEEMAGALYGCKQLAVDLVRSEGQDPEREDEISRACYALDLYKEKTNEQ